MGKHSEVSSSTEWRLRENIVLCPPMECLTPTVKVDIFITISHLFVSRPTLSSQNLSNRCAQQRKCTIVGNKMLQKNGTWQL